MWPSFLATAWPNQITNPTMVNDIITIDSSEEESLDESEEPSREGDQGEATLDCIVSFCCPISSALMKHPVICEDGYTYERDQIEHWLEDNDTSPMTRERLSSKVFRKNYALKGVMEEFSCNSEDTQKKLRNSEDTQKQLHSSMAMMNKMWTNSVKKLGKMESENYTLETLCESMSTELKETKSAAKKTKEKLDMTTKKLKETQEILKSVRGKLKEMFEMATANPSSKKRAKH